jgi:hypothetical protein
MSWTSSRRRYLVATLGALVVYILMGWYLFREWRGTVTPAWERVEQRRPDLMDTPARYWREVGSGSGPIGAPLPRTGEKAP